MVALNLELVSTVHRVCRSLGWALLVLAGCTAEPRSATPELSVSDSVAATRGTERPAAAVAKAETPTGPMPKVEAAETNFDFGYVDLGYEGQHVFEVRNAGDAPLVLSKGDTSCGCIESDIRPTTIPPGGVGQVGLQWSVRQERGPFRQWALIRTNDPRQPELRFSVLGVAQLDLAREPEQIQYIDSPYGLPVTTDAFLYSQIWAGIEIVEITSDLPLLTWKVTPLDEAVQRSYHAKSGVRISVTAPAEMTTAFFEGHLKVKARRAGDAGEPREMHWRVAGGPINGIWLSGDKYDVGGAMVGPVSYNRGGKIALSLKAKSLARELVVEKIESTPPFLQVRAVPIKPQGKYIGLFRIEIEVPPGSPLCNFMAPNQAEVRITTNNPGKPVLSFPVEFAVLDE